MSFFKEFGTFWRTWSTVQVSTEALNCVALGKKKLWFPTALENEKTNSLSGISVVIQLLAIVQDRNKYNIRLYDDKLGVLGRTWFDLAVGNYDHLWPSCSSNVVQTPIMKLFCSELAWTVQKLIVRCVFFRYWNIFTYELVGMHQLEL